MIVDASVWVSGLITQDAHHLASRQWLQEQVRSAHTMVVPTIALPEVAGAIARRTGIPALGHRATTLLRRTPGLRLAAIDDTLGARSARIAADYRLRGADATYVALADSLGLELVTWDEDLHRRARSLVSVSYP